MYAMPESQLTQLPHMEIYFHVTLLNFGRQRTNVEQVYELAARRLQANYTRDVRQD